MDHKFITGDIVIHKPSKKVYKVRDIITRDNLLKGGWLGSVDEIVSDIYTYKFANGRHVPLKSVINSYILIDLEKKEDISIQIEYVDRSCRLANNTATILYGEGNIK